MVKESKYKNFSPIYDRQGKGYAIGAVESYSAKDGKKKNWVAKRFYEKIDDDDPLYLIRSVKKNYKNYLFDSVVDAYSTRVLHTIDRRSPKGKFANDCEYVSRLYKYDGYTIGDNKIKNSNLKEKLYSGEDVKGASMLLKSVVQRIVMDDWDNKLSNYNDEGYSFDLGYAFTSIADKKANERRGDPSNSKRWQDYEILALVSGKNKEGKFLSVGGALAEVIADFGDGTNDYYLKWFKENNPEHYKKNMALKNDVSAFFNKQLQNIVDNNAHISNRSEALLAVFANVVDEFKDNRQSAHHDVRRNINETLSTGAVKKSCYSLLDECDMRFQKRLDDFGAAIEAIQYGKKAKTHVRRAPLGPEGFVSLVANRRQRNLEQHGIY